jgi:hypothetical protein
MRKPFCSLYSKCHVHTDDNVGPTLSVPHDTNCRCTGTEAQNNPCNCVSTRTGQAACEAYHLDAATRTALAVLQEQY